MVIESLFKTAGAATEKEREANEVEAFLPHFYLIIGLVEKWTRVSTRVMIMGLV